LDSRIKLTPNPILNYYYNRNLRAFLTIKITWERVEGHEEAES